MHVSRKVRCLMSELQVKFLANNNSHKLYYQKINFVINIILLFPFPDFLHAVAIKANPVSAILKIVLYKVYYQYTFLHRVS